MLARSSKHKLPQRFQALQNSRIFLGWFSCLNNVRAKADLQPINLQHHSSLNFLGNYYGFTYTILPWISLETTTGWFTYTILPWISLENSPGRRGTNNKLFESMTHHSSSIGFDRFQKILSINQPLHPAPFFSFFLFSFFPFSIFLLISKIFKKKICCWKENRIYNGNTHISNFLSCFLDTQINVPKSHWIFFCLPISTRKHLKHQVQSILYHNH